VRYEELSELSERYEELSELSERYEELSELSERYEDEMSYLSYCICEIRGAI
jgi:hypothetical protein